MKKQKAIWILLVVAAVVFASVFPAYAIDFVAEEKYDSVFVIHSGNALGSGFALGSNCVITNAHVIDDPTDVTVLCYDGTEHTAWVLGMDEDQDIAVLMVENVSFPILEVAQEDTIKTGGDVYAIGAPKSMAYTLTKGVISAKERQLGSYTYVQTDAPINEGNSGGPLLSDTGTVVGMNTMKMNDSEGIGLAIPIKRICQYVQNLDIPLDEKGNVVGTVEKPAPAETEGTVPYESQQPEVIVDTRYAKQAAIATVVATLSIVLNVLLIIILLMQRRKNPTLPPAPPADPRERTDFDIEILE